MKAYHFVGATLRDGQAVPEDGEWLVHEGEIKMCESGLHASEHPADALQYAPGPILCLVECEEIHARDDDKSVCRRRKIIARCDATDLLRQYARWCALQVVDLWDAPTFVRQYLNTGDESLRADAERAARRSRDAARSAARYAARRAAWAAARRSRDAARYAARYAARHAAWAAAWAAVRAAALSAQDAALDAVRATALDAVRATALDAARAAVRAAALDAALDAALSAQDATHAAAPRTAAFNPTLNGWDAAWVTVADQREKLKQLVDAKFSAMGVS